MTMGERIKAMRKAQGLTQEELGNMLGIKKAAVQKYEKGTVKNIKYDTLMLLAEIFGTSVEYIVSGGDVLPENMRPAVTEDAVRIPVLANVSAGMGCHANSFADNAVSFETVSADTLTSDGDYVYMRVTGDSMYPVFMEGDLALVRVQSSVDSGSYAVVIIDNDNGVIKKVVYGDDYIELHSVNPMYPTRQFTGAAVMRIRVFGLVKECRRKF